MKNKIGIFLLAIVVAIGCLFQIKSVHAQEVESFDITGAAIRFSDPSGIKFVVEISESDYNALAEGGTKEVNFGCLITLKSIALDNLLTVENAATYQAKNVETPTHSTEESNYYFKSVIYGIPESAYDEAFVARGYYEIDGEYTYTDQIERSISNVAYQALLSGEEDSDNYDELRAFLANEKVVSANLDLLENLNIIDSTAKANYGADEIYNQAFSKDDFIALLSKISTRLTATGDSSATKLANANIIEEFEADYIDGALNELEGALVSKVLNKVSNYVLDNNDTLTDAQLTNLVNHEIISAIDKTTIKNHYSKFGNVEAENLTDVVDNFVVLIDPTLNTVADKVALLNALSIIGSPTAWENHLSIDLTTPGSDANTLLKNMTSYLDLYDDVKYLADEEVLSASDKVLWLTKGINGAVVTKVQMMEVILKLGKAVDYTVTTETAAITALVTAACIGNRVAWDNYVNSEEDNLTVNNLRNLFDKVAAKVLANGVSQEETGTAKTLDDTIFAWITQSSIPVGSKTVYVVDGGTNRLKADELRTYTTDGNNLTIASTTAKAGNTLITILRIISGNSSHTYSQIKTGLTKATGFSFSATDDATVRAYWYGVIDTLVGGASVTVDAAHFRALIEAVYNYKNPSA